MTVDLDQKEQKEIDFWKNSPTESPESNSFANKLNKLEDARVFLDCWRRFQPVFAAATTILEIGAGQGWASCVVKYLHPEAHVIVTDISKWAVASVPKWEQILQVKLDEVKVCKSYDIDVPSGSVDCAFCFSSAHHFGPHRRTLMEIHRILKPGGRCLYLYEPSCRVYLYRVTVWQQQTKRNVVPEDILIYKKIQKLAKEAGLHCELDFYPSLIKRGKIEAFYFTVLNWLPILQKLLPCTINYQLRKPTG